MHNPIRPSSSSRIQQPPGQSPARARKPLLIPSQLKLLSFPLPLSLSLALLPSSHNNPIPSSSSSPRRPTASLLHIPAAALINLNPLIMAPSTTKAAAAKPKATANGGVVKKGGPGRKAKNNNAKNAMAKMQSYCEFPYFPSWLCESARVGANNVTLTRSLFDGGSKPRSAHASSFADALCFHSQGASR